MSILRRAIAVGNPETTILLEPRLGTSDVQVWGEFVNPNVPSNIIGGHGKCWGSMPHPNLLIFAGMPRTRQIDNGFLEFVAHLLVTSDNPTHLARVELFQPFPA